MGIVKWVRKRSLAGKKEITGCIHRNIKIRITIIKFMSQVKNTSQTQCHKNIEKDDPSRIFVSVS